MKTIGIDVNVLARAQWTGVERYVFSLVKALIKEGAKDGERFLLYASRVIEELGVLPKGFEWKIVSWPLPKGWTHGGLSVELFRHPPDVFLSPGHEVPVGARAGAIVGVVHDVAFAKSGEAYGRKEHLRQRASLRILKARAKHIITPSELTKSDLIQLFRFDPKRVTAIWPGLPEEGVRVGGVVNKVLDRPYLLSVGRLEAKKNTAFLVRAFEKAVKDRGLDADLVLVGKFGFGREEIEKTIESSSVKNRVHVRGFVNDAELVELYRGASAFVFPSLEEGFGFPILEAMRAGVPALCSSIPIFNEVGADAVLQASPESLEDFSSKLIEITTDGALREKLMVAGRERVKLFSWEKTAKTVLELLRGL